MRPGWLTADRTGRDEQPTRWTRHGVGGGALPAARDELGGAMSMDGWRVIYLAANISSPFCVMSIDSLNLMAPIRTRRLNGSQPLSSCQTRAAAELAVHAQPISYLFG